MEVQTPALNFEKQEFEMFSKEGPVTELVQSNRELGSGHLVRKSQLAMLRTERSPLTPFRERKDLVSVKMMQE